MLELKLNSLKPDVCSMCQNKGHDLYCNNCVTSNSYFTITNNFLIFDQEKFELDKSFIISYMNLLQKYTKFLNLIGFEIIT